MSAAVSFQNVPSMQIHLYILQANWNLYSKNRDYEYCNQHTLWVSQAATCPHAQAPAEGDGGASFAFACAVLLGVCLYTYTGTPRVG